MSPPFPYNLHPCTHKSTSRGPAKLNEVIKRSRQKTIATEDSNYVTKYDQNQTGRDDDQSKDQDKNKSKESLRK